MNISVAKILLFLIFINSIYSALADPDSNENFSVPSLSRILLLDAARNGNTRILVGERGYVFVSHDGQFWDTKELSTGATLTAAFLYDDKHGWVVGHDAVIYRTSNGGDTWQKIYSAPEEESPLLDIWFNDQDSGIAIGAYGLYLTTDDGGKSWSRKNMLIVNDQGNNESRNSANSNTEDFDLHLNAIAKSASGKLYVVAEAGHIYRSDDLGDTWLELNSPYNGSLFGVLPLPDDSLLVLGLRGHVYHSDDDGKNWTSIDTGIDEMLTNGLVISDRKVLITGMGGSILLSNDMGRSFSSINVGNRNNFSSIIENNNNEYLITGDHGMKKYTGLQLGVIHE